MAKIELDPHFKSISGTVGNKVFKTTKDGRIFITSKPSPRKTKPSKAELAQRAKFAQNVQIATRILAVPEYKEYFERKLELTRGEYKSLRGYLISQLNAGLIPPEYFNPKGKHYYKYWAEFKSPNDRPNKVFGPNYRTSDLSREEFENFMFQSLKRCEGVDVVEITPEEYQQALQDAVEL